MNLIGDHTDYQDGLCLPMAIGREVRIAFTARTDAEARVRSEGFAEVVEAAAVLDVLGDLGRPPVGFDAEITSTIPVGAGLSSSAALAVALALAAAAVADFPLAGRELALAAQEIEHRASGVPCGLMDQMASVFGRAGHALLVDCRTLTVDPVPLPPGAEFAVVHSGLPRRLDTSAYAQRRAACEAAAARIGVATLRDATESQVAGDPFARHVVTENARVLSFADALRRADLDTCGRLMLESHESLRDDFAVSTPELDLLVEESMEHGAAGARLTGAGFGGCVLVLGRAGVDVAGPVTARYRALTGLDAISFTVRAVDGAGEV